MYSCGVENSKVNERIQVLRIWKVIHKMGGEYGFTQITLSEWLPSDEATSSMLRQANLREKELALTLHFAHIHAYTDLFPAAILCGVRSCSLHNPLITTAEREAKQEVPKKYRPRSDRM